MSDGYEYCARMPLWFLVSSLAASGTTVVTWSRRESAHRTLPPLARGAVTAALFSADLKTVEVVDAAAANAALADRPAGHLNNLLAVSSATCGIVPTTIGASQAATARALYMKHGFPHDRRKGSRWGVLAEFGLYTFVKLFVNSLW